MEQDGIIVNFCQSPRQYWPLSEIHGILEKAAGDCSQPVQPKRKESEEGYSMQKFWNVGITRMKKTIAVVASAAAAIALTVTAAPLTGYAVRIEPAAQEGVTSRIFGSTGSEKEFYRQISQAVTQGQESLTITLDQPVSDQEKFIELCRKAVYQARRDYPESFLSNHTEFVYYYNESGYYQVTFSFRYLDLTDAQKQAMFDVVDSIVAQARAQTGGDTVGMLRYFQQALCERAEYDFAAARSDSDHYPNSYHAYGALMEGKSVCQGYAYAFKLLCDKAQIPCWIVTGTYGDEPHAWNYVWVNNNYYLVDVTWDDANNRPADSASFLAGRDHAANYHVEDNCAPGTLAARSYSEDGTTVIRRTQQETKREETSGKTLAGAAKG